METYIGQVEKVLMVCVSGPDAGKRFAIDQTPRTLGRNDKCHLFSDDTNVGDQTVVFLMRENRPFFQTEGAQDVYVDGAPLSRGKIRPGQQLRIGRSIWQVADEHAADQFAGWLAKVGGHIGAAAGLGKVEGFSVKKMFSDVFKSHPDDEVDDYFSVGSPATTPSLADIDTSWPRPWVFARAAAMSVLVYFGFSLAMSQWNNLVLLPGMMMIGAFAIPMSVLILFFEMNVPRNVSLYQTIKLLIIGAILSLCFAMIGFGMTDSAARMLGAMIKSSPAHAPDQSLEVSLDT